MRGKHSRAPFTLSPEPPLFFSAEAEVKAAGKSPTNVRTIAADFSVPSEALFKRISEELSGLDIAILV